MKNYISIIALMLVAIPALANEKGNGGDVCESRFQSIREDIHSWIIKGGSRSLNLPEAFPIGQYNFSMLKQIEKAQVSCVDEILHVGNAEKTCINLLNAEGKPRIICNRKAFLETPKNDQYMLVHHEYAGLAGLETNAGENSNYLVSKQLYPLTSAIVGAASVSGDGILQGESPEKLREHFGDFTGAYQIVKCSSKLMLDKKELVVNPNDTCNYKNVRIIFGHPPELPLRDPASREELKDVLYLFQAKNGDFYHHWALVELAFADKDLDQTEYCRTMNGVQFCSYTHLPSKNNPVYNRQVSMVVVDKLLYLHIMRVTADDSGAKMYYDETQVLEKISN